jgi:hypothetical protein
MAPVMDDLVFAGLALVATTEIYSISFRVQTYQLNSLTLLPMLRRCVPIPAWLR